MLTIIIIINFIQTLSGSSLQSMAIINIIFVSDRVTGRLTRCKQNRLASGDSYAGFEDIVDRDHWYRMILEVQNGWKVSQARKDPGVMETAMCHVVLLDALIGSGLLDRFNHTQRTKCMMVRGRGVRGGGGRGIEA